MEPDRPILDYAHPSREREYARTEDDDRLDAVARYNEAEFGEQYPFVRGPVVRAAIYFAVIAGISLVFGCLLPNEIARPLDWIVSAGLVLWWEFRIVR